MLDGASRTTAPILISRWTSLRRTMCRALIRSLSALWRRRSGNWRASATWSRNLASGQNWGGKRRDERDPPCSSVPCSPRKQNGCQRQSSQNEQPASKRHDLRGQGKNGPAAIKECGHGLSQREVKRLPDYCQRSLLTLPLLPAYPASWNGEGDTFVEQGHADKQEKEPGADPASRPLKGEREIEGEQGDQ